MDAIQKHKRLKHNPIPSGLEFLTQKIESNVERVLEPSFGDAHHSHQRAPEQGISQLLKRNQALQASILALEFRKFPFSITHFLDMQRALPTHPHLHHTILSLLPPYTPPY